MRNFFVIELVEDRIRELTTLFVRCRFSEQQKFINSLIDLNLTILKKIDPSNEMFKDFEQKTHH